MFFSDDFRATKAYARVDWKKKKKDEFFIHVVIFFHADASRNPHPQKEAHRSETQLSKQFFIKDPYPCLPSLPLAISKESSSNKQKKRVRVQKSITIFTLSCFVPSYLGESPGLFWLVVEYGWLCSWLVSRLLPSVGVSVPGKASTSDSNRSPSPIPTVPNSLAFRTSLIRPPLYSVQYWPNTAPLRGVATTKTDCTHKKKNDLVYFSSAFGVDDHRLTK